ncbi:MAG TPA: uracil-DNA glycosylase, partial [Spirochaetota bacterium]|nr:uracil-DNA glycosylase [Spirochaetota bacterium]
MKNDFINVVSLFHSYISGHNYNVVYHSDQVLNIKPEIKSEDLKNLNYNNKKSVDIWEELKKNTLKCIKCRLYSTRHSVVFGEGNKDSMLLIIGEAPGYEEDMQGRPFVGEAGKLLTKMLNAIDINRENVFITNVLKCRPPENRDPRPDEIFSCSPI